jgi:hypothetical protein
MKITIESTSHMTEINGVPARVWEGHTERGVPVICCITRLAVHEDADAGELERDLKEVRPPSPDATAAIPARMIL